MDTDHDGVRDDVQRWIYAFHPDDLQKQRVLRQWARYFQEELNAGYGPAQRRKTRILLDRTLDCQALAYPTDPGNPQGYFENRYLKAKMLNTKERTIRYLENDWKVTTEESAGPWFKDEHPCDDR